MKGGVSRVAVGVVLAILAACGGGGGGGEGDGSTFHVTPASLSFTAAQNGPLPAHQSIHVRIVDTRLDYGSGWEGGPWPTWIDEPTFASIPAGAVDFDHELAITTTALPPGTYTARFVTRTSEPGPTWPPELVEEKSVRVTYTVTPP